MTILVFDCETIPDPRCGATETDTSGLKPGCQQIVALAAAWIDEGGSLQRLAALGTVESPEAELVQQFFQIVETYHPRLVGWNSSGFDLPVLVYRAMVHHVVAPKFYTWGAPYQGYRKRFDEDSHLDLMDVLSFYGASTRMKLDEMARILGIPGKQELDGSQVAYAEAAGQRAAIRQYCVSDVLTTALIYGRYAAHRGWWTADQYHGFVASVDTWLAQQPEAYWQRYAQTWADRAQNVDDGMRFSSHG
ncbi:3'-5' exonuclease [Sulfobacillus thermosulfidooxidans]|uniref:3'-5' exonuclease n=1 Tax=Sulfobacillus thermosulfidooxidans TaxID=28034 RepID=UPI0006B54F49|nr:3'-5' exonuclease [Sulfobacillus thermosulfidooxidans]